MADEGDRSETDESPSPEANGSGQPATSETPEWADDREQSSTSDPPETSEGSDHPEGSGSPETTLGRDPATSSHTDPPEVDEGVGWIDKETLLDVIVNGIPMVMLLFFIVLFTIVQPWGYDSAMFVIMHSLTVIPFVLLGILTYYAARAVSRDEAELERRGIDEEEQIRQTPPDEST